MTQAIIEDEGGEYSRVYAGSIWVLYVKLPCALALHLYLYPEVQKGMMIMKFANNQPDQFVENGSQISFCLGVLQFVLAIYTEIINVYRLSYQHTVEHCIIHFVALEIIMELNKIYFESLNDPKLKEVMHMRPTLKHKGVDIKFSDRSIFHQLARVAYKLMRSLYISTIFYFVPLITLLNNFKFAIYDPHADHH